MGQRPKICLFLRTLFLFFLMGAKIQKELESGNGNREFFGDKRNAIRRGVFAEARLCCKVTHLFGKRLFFRQNHQKDSNPSRRLIVQSFYCWSPIGVLSTATADVFSLSWNRDSPRVEKQIGFPCVTARKAVSSSAKKPRSQIN